MKSRMLFPTETLAKFYYKFLALVIMLGLCSSVQAQNSGLWEALESPEFELQASSLDNSTNGYSSSSHDFENATLMTLNKDLMHGLLDLNHLGEKYTTTLDSDIEIGARGASSLHKYKISLPLPDGNVIDLDLVPDSVLPPQLAAKYPEINTYRILPNKLVFGGKVDMTPEGFHAMLNMFDGEVVFIDPTELSKNEYAIYNKSAQKTDPDRVHSCGVSTDIAARGFSQSNTLDARDQSSFLSSPIISARTLQNDLIAAARPEGSLKNYTIAIATTGEYSARFGSNVGSTLAAITTTLNRVNQILERDLGIHLNLAENNDLIINTNASSDPFVDTRLIDLVFQNQDYIDATLGNENYDIGHLFTTSGGGLAAIGSACISNDKAKAASGIASPMGDSFDLDFVAHEIGHQLGATHTFNSTQGACSAETRTARSAFEPGSGSTIMSYAGTCGLDNIQPSTDPMYHIGSIKQIAEYTNNGFGSRCGVLSTSQNSAPEADAGEDHTIPARTPFELDGTATDADGDSLVYAWEQVDTGDVSTVSADTGNNALFRVHVPNQSKSRSFPPLEALINQETIRGETLPNHERDLTMSFVAQDGFNAAVSDEMLVKVVRTGSRFALNLPRASYTSGSAYPIFWNVANTDRAPINCSSVNVWLSLDKGKSFKYPVAENVPNNGETLITIPADVSISSQGRFKLKCSNNVFFAVSSRNFFVTELDNSVSIRHADADLAEANLRDLPLDVETDLGSSNTVVVNTISSDSSSGGGALDIIVYLLMLFFVGLKSHRIKSNLIIVDQ